jgi:spermidine synthase
MPWFETAGMSPGIAHVLAAALPTLLCAIAPGMLFPTVWPGKAPEQECRTGGAHARVLGRYAGWNKLASALGSLAFPFLLLPWLGYGGTFLVLAMGYGVTALLVSRSKGAPALWPGLAVLLLIAFLSSPLWSWAQHRFRVAVEHPLAPVWEGEVLAVRSSPYGSIRVVDDVAGSRRIFVGRRYSLNGTNQALNHQRNQALIPWMLANQPERVLHLGMGSGITSAAFLQPGVTGLHTVEIIPEVAELAHEYFEEWNAPLFTDARVKVHCDDGRRVVRLADVPFDLIVADLFHPARPSTRLLYLQEFFATVRMKLSESGLFCLWLPVFQLDDALFEAVAGNFAEVFPEAVLIRGNFSPRQPLLGLVGWKNPPASLEDAWHSAKLHSPAIDSAPTFFFIQPENFLLTFVAPVSALSMDKPRPLRWDQPWFSLHAAAIGDKPGKLRGGRLLPWMEEVVGRWDTTNSSSPLARASRAAIRHYDGLLPWTIPTTSEAQQTAKEAHAREQSGKAKEIYPEALWFTEHD